MVVAGVLAGFVRKLHAPWIPYAPGALVLTIGFVIAVLSKEPYWFNRFGALLVILALLTATSTFRLQQEYEGFRDRLNKYQQQIFGGNDASLIVSEDGKQYYRLEFPEVALWGIVRAAEIGVENQAEGVLITFPAPPRDPDEGPLIFRIRPKEFERFHNEIQTATRRELNDLIKIELAYAAVGTLVWSFGDLAIFWL